MQVSKNFKSKKAPEDFRKIEWYFEHFCEILESTVDERILGKCENLFVGVFSWQRTARQWAQSILGVFCINKIDWE